MKKTFCLLIISLVVLNSCKRSERNIDGMYLNPNNRIVYALELNKNSVKIFLQSTNSKKDFKTFVNAKYKIENEKLILNEIESNLLPSVRKNEIISEIQANTIKIKCEEFSREIIGSNYKCLEENLTFTKK